MDLTSHLDTLITTFFNQTAYYFNVLNSITFHGFSLLNFFFSISIIYVVIQLVLNMSLVDSASNSAVRRNRVEKANMYAEKRQEAYERNMQLLREQRSADYREYLKNKK